MIRLGILFFVLALSACAAPEQYDILIRNGRVYDGSGTPATVASVAIRGDRIAAIGSLDNAQAPLTIDARGALKPCIF